jgi:hypothetical protein
MDKELWLTKPEIRGRTVFTCQVEAQTEDAAGIAVRHVATLFAGNGSITVRVEGENLNETMMWLEENFGIINDLQLTRMVIAALENASDLSTTSYMELFDESDIGVFRVAADV